MLLKIEFLPPYEGEGWGAYLNIPCHSRETGNLVFSFPDITELAAGERPQAYDSQHIYLLPSFCDIHRIGV